MNEHLLRYAIDTIWCNPGQDKQRVYRLARVTRPRGVLQQFSLSGELYKLPTDDRYHVYQIGKIHPGDIGVPDVENVWYSLSALANSELLFTDVYTNDGIQFPRFETFVRLLRDNNFLVAVKVNDRIHDLDKHDLFIRFYSNAYFESLRSVNHRHMLVMGTKLGNQSDILGFQQSVEAAVAGFEGVVYYYINGRFCNNISLVNSTLGDTVEAVFDGSIKRVVDFELKDLPSFNSVLDEVHKYLLHYYDPSVKTIDYLDDIDVYLIKRKSATRFSGVYYHHNESRWMRMVTHKDYSVPIDRVNSFVVTHPEDQRHVMDPVTWPSDLWSSVNELTLRLHIRHSGYDRPLQPNSNRIQELYKLTDKQIVNAMVGDVASLDLWNASVLEKCPYVQFMGAPPEFVYPIAFNEPDVDTPDKRKAQEFVGDVFGYHAAAKILADGPSKTYVRDTLRLADLPYEHWQDTTAFEYDAAGKLLGYHYHPLGQHYIVRNPLARKVEAMSGRGGDGFTTTHGTGPVEIPKGYNYRLYVCSVIAGAPQYDWRDISELPAAELAQYGIHDTSTGVERWVWGVDAAKYYGAVRTDHRFILKAMRKPLVNGVLDFVLETTEVIDGVPLTKPVDIPYGQVDVLLNGKSLVPGIDFKQIGTRWVISNREYVNQAEQFQDVLVRAFGFCPANLVYTERTESGFVKYGVLSADGQTEVWENKVLRIVIDGNLHSYDEVVWDEERVERRIAGERNGAPYMVQQPPVVFHDVYESDVAARLLDDDRDSRVSQYLTLYNPPPVRPPLDPIPTKYTVNSVFAQKLLQDLITGTFTPVGIDGHYSESDIRAWCKGYEWLLPFDIANTDFDQQRVQVLPHWYSVPQALTQPQYAFYQRALATYLRFKIDVSPYLTIKVT